ncbi:MAG TPA: hypothetical protein VK750_03245 [Cytophagaceae bacterium]|jgi:hypothetical protein|nr:hypothetical protein [Cytophagaceae bacterium]
MKNYLSIFLLACLFASCQSSKKDASESNQSAPASDTLVNHAVINKDSCTDGLYHKYAHAYNNFIVDHQSKIVEKNIDFVKALERKAPQEKVAALYTSLTQQTQESIDSLGKLCAFNGDLEFKNSALALFKFYQQAWTEYKGLVEVKNEKERMAAFEKIRTRFNEIHSKTEKELEEKFAAAHTHFSNEYELHVRRTAINEKLDSMLYLK